MTGCVQGYSVDRAKARCQGIHSKVDRQATIYIHFGRSGFAQTFLLLLLRLSLGEYVARAWKFGFHCHLFSDRRKECPSPIPIPGHLLVRCCGVETGAFILSLQFPAYIQTKDELSFSSPNSTPLLDNRMNPVSVRIFFLPILNSFSQLVAQLPTIFLAALSGLSLSSENQALSGTEHGGKSEVR
ncbi:hypothetical protein VTK56DRAFT_9729 [Thermocarpiscus australiensis]